MLVCLLMLSVSACLFAACSGVPNVNDILDSIQGGGDENKNEDSEGLEYSLSDGSYAVTGIGTCKQQNIVIPSSYQGLPVTSISKEAFKNCNLKSVTIPDSMTSIGNDAFNYCFRLIEVIDHSSLPITMGSDSCGYIAYYAKTVHNGKTQIVNQDE